jgi:hypothetical protein
MDGPPGQTTDIGVVTTLATLAGYRLAVTTARWSEPQHLLLISDESASLVTSELGKCVVSGGLSETCVGRQGQRPAL